MNLAEAKEIVANTPPEFNQAQPRVLYFEAKAYLEGYARAEKLVEALEKIRKAPISGVDQLNDLDMREIAMEALEEWKKENGG